MPIEDAWRSDLLARRCAPTNVCAISVAVALAKAKVGEDPGYGTSQMIIRLFAALTCLLPLTAAAQSLGTIPSVSLHARDVYAEHRLPPFKDGPKEELAAAVSDLQVIARARVLGLTKTAPTEAWRASEALYRDAAAAATPPSAEVIVSATKASDLNRVLVDATVRSVRLSGPSLEMDEPIRIQRNDLTVDLAGSELKSAGTMSYRVRIEGARRVTLTGGRFDSGNSAILVAESEQVVVRGNDMSGLAGNGLVVTGSKRVVAWENRFTGLQGAGIVLHAGTADSVVARNEIMRNVGSSNWQAGILVSDRDAANLAIHPKSIFGPDGYWSITQKIVQRLKPPRNNVIARNRIAFNRSSGIYVDGAVQTVIVSNLMEGNSKEGLCLDYGATGNVVALNTLHQNGQRWGKTDDELAKDGVLGFGRLQDGTAAAKLPAISIDNAAYNIVFGNAVTRNYGGGVKMVRTAFYNVIGLNTLLDNNEGASDRGHFFGVELGSAKADAPTDELDFKPSRGNIVFSNLIQGNHYAGVFFGEGSDWNDVFDNIIFGAKSWALESVRRQPNSSLNNLTNLPSRNIGSGVDPALLSIGAARFD